MTKLINNQGEVTAVYDGYGTALQTSDLTTYDRAGNVIADRNANGVTTTYTVDSMGQTVATLDALGRETQSHYNLDGQLLLSIDALGNQTQYVYNSVGEQTEMIETGKQKL